MVLRRSHHHDICIYLLNMREPSGCKWSMLYKEHISALRDGYVEHLGSCLLLCLCCCHDACALLVKDEGTQWHVCACGGKCTVWGQWFHCEIHLEWAHVILLFWCPRLWDLWCRTLILQGWSFDKAGCSRCGYQNSSICTGGLPQTEWN